MSSNSWSGRAWATSAWTSLISRGCCRRSRGPGRDQRQAHAHAAGHARASSGRADGIVVMYGGFTMPCVRPPHPPAPYGRPSPRPCEPRSHCARRPQLPPADRPGRGASMYSLTHLTDAVLLRQLTSLVHHDRASTAMLLAHLAEVDMRRLYAPAGYPSMHAFCVERLGFSDDAAFRRIRAARAARQFPALFTAGVGGRAHLPVRFPLSSPLPHRKLV